MGNNIAFRHAKLTDKDLLFSWANDPEVRKSSFYSEHIPYETHCQWFEKKLLDPNARLLIFELEGLPVGLCRFEMQEDNAIIGVSLDPAARGKGLGKIILDSAVEYFFQQWEVPIDAYIRKDNVRSVKAFSKAGFIYFKEDVVNDIPCFIYRIEKR